VCSYARDTWFVLLVLVFSGCSAPLVTTLAQSFPWWGRKIGVHERRARGARCHRSRAGRVPLAAEFQGLKWDTPPPVEGS